MSERKYNTVMRDPTPRSYNLLNGGDKSYQFYFYFTEPVKLTRSESTRYGITVREEYIDEIITGSPTPLETAESILAHKRRLLYSSDIKDLEAVVEFLRKHEYEDGRLALLDEIERWEKKLAALLKEYADNYSEAVEHGQ